MPLRPAKPHLHHEKDFETFANHKNFNITTPIMPPTKVIASIPSKVQDFTVLPIHLPPQPSYPNANVTHYLYLRRDAPKGPEEQTADTKRSLFVANIPIDATEEAFRKLFKESCGARVERVEFDDEGRRSALTPGVEMMVQGTLVTVPVAGKKRKRGVNSATAESEAARKIMQDMELPQTWDRKIWKSGSSAVVVFVDETTRNAVLKECGRVNRKGTVVQWPEVEEGEELGSKRYRTHHSLTYPPRDLLQKSVNTYLTHFTSLETARSKLLARQRQVPDEDGFITVTRGGRAGPARMEEAQAAQERLQEREKKRIGGDFYRFQTREGRKMKERELKDKFEIDRRRLREMRERRGRIRPD